MIDISGLLAYMVVTMITPGPNNLTMMYLSAQYGFRGTVKFLSGSASALLVKVFLCGALNLLLAETIPALVGWLKWLGAAYMLYLAYVMGSSGWRSEGVAERKSETGFGAGVLLQVLNVKSWISCLSLFAVYVVPVTAKLSVIAAVSVIYFLIMAAASMIWGLFGSVMRSICTRYRKPFGLVMAASLIYCALTALI